MKFFIFLIILLISIANVTGQVNWGMNQGNLTRDGKSVYLSGVNYTFSDGWMINLPNLGKESFDADMAALQKLGINHIRCFPMWQLTQPTIDRIDENVMKHLDLLVKSAQEHNISLQISPITGWMSGAVFLPPWAEGDLFRDPRIIEGEKFLCKTIAERYQNSSAVMGYDFGNELNVLTGMVSRGASRDQVFDWMKQIYSAFKDNSHDKLITDGIGTGYDTNFDIRNITQTVDYLAPHSYPYFHGTFKLDPWYGQRSSYSPNFIVSWCKMVGKPVVLQEFGCSESWMPPSKIGAYLRLCYFSTWADGAAGFIWWGSHDIDTTFRVKSKDLILKHSIASFAKGQFDALEYHTGLLSTKNVPKDYASSYAQSIKTVHELGFSWKDHMPVCYIVVPSDVSFIEAMPKFITAYSLAKQAHFDVKLCYEGTPVPPDAQAVFVPGLKLTGIAKEVIQNFLLKGGKVYQSYMNDFGSAITAGADTVVNNPSMVVNSVAGLMEIGEPMSIPAKVTFRRISFSEPAKALVSFTRDDRLYFSRPKPNECVFLSQPVGKGTYFYFAGNLESGLVKTYNPWSDTNCELFYSVLKPKTYVDIDNKFVELCIKKRGEESLMLFLNHSEQYQHVTVGSVEGLSLINFETHEKIGNGKEITMFLKPAEVVIALMKGSQE